jgi:hypothetical protein
MRSDFSPDLLQQMAAWAKERKGVPVMKQSARGRVNTEQSTQFKIQCGVMVLCQSLAL